VQVQVFGPAGSSSSYNNCVAGYGAAGAATGAGISLVGTAGAGSLIGPEGTAAGLVINQVGLAALGTYAGQKAAQFIGSIVCNAGSGTGGGTGTGTGSGSKRVTFGHGARHLAGTGLEQTQVENAIKTQVEEIASGSSSTGSRYTVGLLRLRTAQSTSELILWGHREYWRAISNSNLF
jgi:hypothetical protein